MAEKRVVGVYADDAAAERAIEAAERAGASSVVRGGRADHVASLHDEMREEMEHTFVGPGNVGPFTKEMTKGMVRWTPAWTLLFMVLAVPVAFIPFADLSFWVRLAIVEAVAVATGATIGFMVGLILGGGEADKGIDRQERALAAERGVVVGVTVDELEAERVADAMATADPIRLDISGMEGQPLSTLATEEDPRR